MLLDAVPDLAMTGQSRTAVAGEVPNPLDPPPGCTFHPRCPHANERCRTRGPAARCRPRPAARSPATPSRKGRLPPWVRDSPWSLAYAWDRLAALFRYNSACSGARPDRAPLLASVVRFRSRPHPLRLTQIKLAGFKSFVDPTTIATPGQLVGIVGPNGCGKSNVIDAVRWVLGESKASALRGESMQDVIFNGAGERKPVGARVGRAALRQQRRPHRRPVGPVRRARRSSAC